MKIIGVIVVICIIEAHSASLTNKQIVALRRYISDCAAEVGVEKDVIDKLLKSESFNQNDKFNCFASCVLQKVGFLRADGKIDEETIRKKVAESNINANHANKVLEKCKSLSGKDLCETGGLILNCFIANKSFSILH